MEHTLSDGSKISSIYGHLDPTTIRVNEGQDDVPRGAVLGEVGHWAINGEPCWGDHLHFAIWKGAYGAAVGVYPQWLVGYLPDDQFPDAWVAPVEFINTTPQQPSTQFAIGDTVEVTADAVPHVNVHESANGTTIGSEPPGARGSIVGGPTYAGGYWWWEVGFDDGVNGWADEDYLEKVGAPSTLLIANTQQNYGVNTILSPPDTIFDATTGNGVLSVTLLNAALSTGNVVVSNNSGSIEVAAGASIDWNGANYAHSLTVTAAGDITLDAGRAIVNSGRNPTIVLQADNGGTGTGTVQGAGQIDLSDSSRALVTIFYNPLDYAHPTDFSSLIVSGSSIPHVVSYMLVNSASDLQNIASKLSGTYALGTDIDLTGLTFTPLGTSSNPFTGVLEGNGHSINGLTISSSLPEVGLFGVIGAAGEVDNVALTSTSVQGVSDRQYIGAVAGISDGKIIRASSSGSVTGGAISAVGGIVGALGSAFSVGGNPGTGLVLLSSSAADVTGADNPLSYATGIGGLVGSNAGRIARSYATGSVAGGTNDIVGGLVGVEALVEATITQSYATGPVAAGSGSSVGGFVGTNFDTVVNESYAVGSVSGSGTNSIAGFAGVNGACDPCTATIDQSYSAGSVGDSQAQHIGGLVGSTALGLSLVTNSYWDTQASGQTASHGGTAVDTASLQSALQQGFAQSALQPEFDYTEGTATGVWAIYPTYPAYPVLVYPMSQLSPGQPYGKRLDGSYKSVGSVAYNQRTGACLATVYAMIAHSAGQIGKDLTDAQKFALAHVMVDDFWDERYGAVDTLLTNNGVELGNATTLSDALTHLGYGPVVIKGSIDRSGGGSEFHWMLAVGYSDAGQTAIVANDPWTGDRVIIDIGSGKVIDILDPVTGKFVELNTLPVSPSMDCSDAPAHFTSLLCNPVKNKPSYVALNSFTLLSEGARPILKVGPTTSPTCTGTPTGTLSASPDRVAALGDTVTISWSITGSLNSSSDVADCEIQGSDGTSYTLSGTPNSCDASGSTSVTVTQQTVYTLYCNGSPVPASSGSGNARTIVNVPGVYNEF